jgi:site-specific DNA-methyltransferase (adenine-specific)
MIARVLSGAERWTIACGDNLEVMRAMPPASVDLLYGDTLYATGSTFHLPDGRVAYEDRHESLDSYLSDLRERCAAGRDLLAGHGTFVLQVDPETSHYVKVMLDGIFGRECFRNEIIWRYRRWPTRSRDFQRMHDVLFRYVRNHRARWRWNQLFEPLSPRTVAIHGTKKQRHTITEKGRKWGAQVASDAEDSPGAYLSDVWEIGVIAPKSRERAWPTQKPTDLAARVILACSDPGDVVLDPWSGGGTFVSVAVEHDRRGIGIDQSPLAVELGTARVRVEELAREEAARRAAALESQVALPGVA